MYAVNATNMIRAYQDVLVKRHGDGVVEVVINRPQRRNALSSQVKNELVDFFRGANTASDISAIVLTGAGDRAFASGQDLSEAKDMTPGEIAAWIDSFHDLYSAVLECEKPTVGAANGYAVGAGFQLLMLCDLRVAADNARFGMPEVDDAIPCITGTWTLYNTIGHARTADLVLTGRMIDADLALAWGIVSEVVDGTALRARAVDLATTLARKPAVAVRLNKARLKWLLERERASAETYAKAAHAEAYATGLPQQKMADFLARRREGRST